MFQQPSQVAWLTATFSTAEWRSASGPRQNDEKEEAFRAYNRAFTKNDEAGLERNRFYFCRYVVPINEKVIYRFSVCVSDYILCIAWV